MVERASASRETKVWETPRSRERFAVLIRSALAVFYSETGPRESENLIRVRTKFKSPPQYIGVRHI